MRATSSEVPSCHIHLERMCAGCTDSKAHRSYHQHINNLMQIIIEYAVCA